MWKRLGKWITNNFGLKVLGVVLAIIVWLVIVNVADPDKSATFTVPVEVVNAGYLAEEGKTYEIQGNSDYISFTVSGPRSVVETLDENDFRAMANMENIDESMSMVPIVLTPLSYGSQLEIINRETYLMVSVEDLVTREIEIRTITEGNPANGYFVDSTEAEPGVVSVTGPESEVEQIVFAIATVDVSGAENSVTSTETFILLAENGNVMDSDRLTMDIMETDVTATILQRKEVPISFTATGMPAKGYWYTDPVCDPDTIVIQGDPDVIADIDAFMFFSPALDVDGKSTDVTAVFDLSDLLPEGVSLMETQENPEDAEDQENIVMVTVPVVKADSAETEMPADRLTVENLAEDLSLTITDEQVTVTLEGTKETLESVDGSLLTGTIDASELDEAGNYIVTVNLETDGSFRAWATVPVSIQELVTPPE